MSKRFVDAQVWVRRGTAVQWNTQNPILGPGEFGYSYDNGDLRIGDGILHWQQLPLRLGFGVPPVGSYYTMYSSAENSDSDVAFPHEGRPETLWPDTEWEVIWEDVYT